MLIGLLSEVMAKTLETGLAGTGAPPILAPLIVATISASPEILTALRAALANRMQPVVNIALGASLSTVVLTVPVIEALALFTHHPIQMALTVPQMVMTLLTLLVATINIHDGETNAIEGLTHFVLFAAFLMLSAIGRLSALSRPRARSSSRAFVTASVRSSGENGFTSTAGRVQPGPGRRAGIAGREDHGQPRLARERVARELDARHPGQPDVGHHHVHRMRGQRRQRGRRVERLQHEWPDAPSSSASVSRMNSSSSTSSTVPARVPVRGASVGFGARRRGSTARSRCRSARAAAPGWPARGGSCAPAPRACRAWTAAPRRGRAGRHARWRSRCSPR